MKKGIVYYTDNSLPYRLGCCVRKNLRLKAGNIPIVYVSQKRLHDVSGQDNIVVGEIGRSYISLYQQLITGIESIDADIIYPAEHDIIYPKSHFDFVPGKDYRIYHNHHSYWFNIKTGKFLRSKKNRRALSHLVAKKELLLDHCHERLDDLAMDPKAKLGYKWIRFASKEPVIDIRHGDNFSGDGYHKKRLEGWVDTVPVWKTGNRMLREIGYRNKVLRSDIINHLIEKNDYKSYLEIGVLDPSKNFDFINLPGIMKSGVDPAGKCTFKITSDEFFDMWEKDGMGVKFDLIFIDGLHLAEQVLKDVHNALEHLEKGGTIVMHDCLPANESEQLREKPKWGNWCGDVWKAYVVLRTRDDLEMFVVDENNGVGVIKKGEQNPIVVLRDLTYSFLNGNKRSLLNIKTYEEFLRG